jgi:hypothetical protein
VLNKYFKILIPIAILAMIASISSCSAADLSGFDGLHKLESEMYNTISYANHDCWYFADYAANRLSENGYSCAVVQGTSDVGVSNHRALFVYMNEDNGLHKFESSKAVRDGVGLDCDWWEANAYLSIISEYNGFNYSPLYGDGY